MHWQETGGTSRGKTKRTEQMLENRDTVRQKWRQRQTDKDRVKWNTAIVLSASLQPDPGAASKSSSAGVLRYLSEVSHPTGPQLGETDR